MRMEPFVIIFDQLSYCQPYWMSLSGIQFLLQVFMLNLLVMAAIQDG